MAKDKTHDESEPVDAREALNASPGLKEAAPNPPHEQTLGAIDGAPEDVAREYARTGRTPAHYIRKVVANPDEAALKGLAADEGEEQFAGKSLSEFDGVPDDELEQQDGVGPVTAKEIKVARRARDRRATK